MDKEDKKEKGYSYNRKKEIIPTDDIKKVLHYCENFPSLVRKCRSNKANINKIASWLKRSI